MWWAGSEAHVYVTQVGASLRLPGVAETVSIAANGAAHAMGSAIEALKVHAPRVRRARVWLGGAIARPFMLGSVAGLRDRVEALSIARARAAQYTGLDGPCEVWLDAWQADVDCLAVAMERSLLDAATSEAERWGVRLSGISPAWNAVLTGALADRRPQLLAVREEGALTLLALSDKRVVRASVATPTSDRVEAHIQRSAVSWAIPSDEVMQAELLRLAPVTGGLGPLENSVGVFAVRWQREGSRS